MAQVCGGAARAQQLVDALGRELWPHLAARVFSRNPADVQQALLLEFAAGHFQAEAHYGSRLRLFGETEQHDPHALVTCFAERLSAASGSEQPNAILLANITDQIRQGQE